MHSDRGNPGSAVQRSKKTSAPPMVQFSIDKYKGKHGFRESVQSGDRSRGFFENAIWGQVVWVQPSRLKI